MKQIIRAVITSIAWIAVLGLMGCASTRAERGTTGSATGGYVEQSSDFGVGGTTNATGGTDYEGATGVRHGVETRGYVVTPSPNSYAVTPKSGNIVTPSAQYGTTGAGAGGYIERSSDFGSGGTTNATGGTDFEGTTGVRRGMEPQGYVVTPTPNSNVAPTTGGTTGAGTGGYIERSSDFGTGGTTNATGGTDTQGTTGVRRGVEPGYVVTPAPSNAVAPTPPSGDTTGSGTGGYVEPSEPSNVVPSNVEPAQPSNVEPAPLEPSSE